MNFTDRVRIKIGDLDLKWLDKYSVWSWYQGSPFEVEDEIYPVDVGKDDVSSLNTLFIKSVFLTTEGLRLYGSITFDTRFEEVYGIEFFLNGKSFGFNSGLPELATAEIDRLRSLLEDKHLQILPISYETLVDVEHAKLVLSEKFSVKENRH